MISIIIVNYRQKDFLEKCIRSIYETFLSYPFETIIVNNSPAEDLHSFGSRYANLKIILNENRGYSQANNLAAKNSAGKYLFFLNADTEIRSDFLKTFTDEFEHRQFGAAGMKLHNTDGSFQLSFWKEVNFRNERINKHAEKMFKERNEHFISELEKEYDDVKAVDWVSGAAMIIRKDIFENIGGFDENFFLFYEDADICKRLTDNGFTNYFFPFAGIIHHKGENVNDQFHSDTYYHSKESQLLYYKTHNSVKDNVLLRSYLFIKFLFLYAVTFRKINRDILLLTLGKKRSD